MNARQPGKFTAEFIRFFEGLASAVGIAPKRKWAEEAVQRSEMLLRAVTDSTPAAVFLKDRDGRVLFANPATLAAIGKPREAVLGKTDAEFHDDPAAGNVIMDNDRRVMESGQSQSIEEIMPGPGGPRTFLSTKSPFHDAKGRVLGIVGVSRDITERRREEDSLRQREAELAQLNRARRGRNGRRPGPPAQPAVVCHQQLCGGDRIPPAAAWRLPGCDALFAAVASVTMEVGRAAAIISRLREFVRGREVHRSSVHILQSVRHAVELMQPLARGKGVILAIKAGPGIPIVHADPIQIEQVIVNLVANAIDAVAELPERRRRVTVSAHLSGGEREAGTPHATAGEETEMSHGGCAPPSLPREVEVAVHDGGHGVPPGLRDKLFDAFVSTKKDGLGVGLTISRTIVRAWREDLDGASRTARHVLPLHGAVGLNGKGISVCRLTQRCFLLTTTQAPWIHCGFLLESGGLCVEAFSSARAFLSSYDPDRPGCLVLDLCMPEIDGLALQEKLLAQDSRLPVVFITGHGDVPHCAGVEGRRRRFSGETGSPQRHPGPRPACPGDGPAQPPREGGPTGNLGADRPAHAAGKRDDGLPAAGRGHEDDCRKA